MTFTKISSLTALSLAAALALSACGGGGGNSSNTSSAGSTSGTGNSSGTTSTSATTGNTSTPQYSSTSIEAAAFTLLNQQRTQCGFPALTENTIFDQAAAAHASYMGQNGGLITDTEVSGNPSFTGVTYADRAGHFGFPTTSTLVTGVSGGYYTAASLTNAQYGQQLVYEWLSGVYHIAVGVWPITEVGVGFNQTTFNNFPEVQATLTIGNLQAMTGASTPLTFPCQGTTGVAYVSGGETPTPPNTSGNFGTPVAVAGNPTDTIVLTAGTIADTAGHVFNLQLLDSANDPNKLLPAFEAVAYPTTPLTANTIYSVSLTGTINGTAFTRNFTFTTGNVVG